MKNSHRAVSTYIKDGFLNMPITIAKFVKISTLFLPFVFKFVYDGMT